MDYLPFTLKYNFPHGNLSLTRRYNLASGKQIAYLGCSVIAWI